MVPAQVEETPNAVPVIGSSKFSFDFNPAAKPARTFELRGGRADVAQPPRQRERTAAQIAAGLANLLSQQRAGVGKGTGYMSKATERRITRDIEALVALSQTYEAKLRKLNPGLGYYQQGCYLTFLTLTLCAPQLLDANGLPDDKAVRKMITDFLTYVRIHCGVYHQVNVVESQKNGNLHAHILLDKFIENLPEGQNKADSLPLRLTRAWNEIQRENGYIERYAAAQRVKYANGFFFDEAMVTVRREWSEGAAGWVDVSEVVPEAVQRKRWSEGAANDWGQPNSCDIHALKVDKVASYVASYMTKNERVRPINCRLMGSTHGLKKVKNLVLTDPDQVNEMNQVLDEMVEADEAKKILVTTEGLFTVQEYEDSEMRAAGVGVLRAIYLFKPADFWKRAPAWYAQQYKAHWREQYRIAYGMVPLTRPVLRVSNTARKKREAVDMP